MSLPLVHKPHEAEVFRVQEVVVGDRVLRYERIAVGTVFGQLTERSARGFSAEFGLEAEHPGLFLCDLGAVLGVGDRLRVSGREYRVLADPRVCDAEDRTAHLEVLVDRVSG